MKKFGGGLYKKIVVIFFEITSFVYLITRERKKKVNLIMED